MEKSLTTKDLFGQKTIQQRFEAILGKKAQGFISSVLQVINGNYLLAKADPATVLNAAATAASLDLPINPNLGFAWIVPYKGKAQFQIGWKGFVQLALRTGQYQRINATEVYENQFKSFNRLTEHLDADFNIEGEGSIVGYAAYFKLNNGMEKMAYWSKKEVTKHASKYSQTYGKKNKSGQLIFSPWNDADQFDSMCLKTVLKNTLSKWGIMSIEMQTATLADQSVQSKEGQYDYVDNQETIDVEHSEEEQKRILQFIDSSETMEELNAVRSKLSKELQESYSEQLENRENELILQLETAENGK